MVIERRVQDSSQVEKGGRRLEREGNAREALRRTAGSGTLEGTHTWTQNSLLTTCKSKRKNRHTYFSDTTLHSTILYTYTRSVLTRT